MPPLACLAQARDYSALFSHLEENGIGLFFPTFQYTESPTPLSYGFEADFLPPCSPEDPAFKAPRASNIKLIIPGPLPFPDLPMEDDTNVLSQFLTCAGGHVAAVSNFDEPFSQEVPFDMVALLYNLVNEVNPTLDVLMVLQGFALRDMFADLNANLATPPKRTRACANGYPSW